MVDVALHILASRIESLERALTACCNSPSIPSVATLPTPATRKRKWSSCDAPCPTAPPGSKRTLPAISAFVRFYVWVHGLQAVPQCSLIVPFLGADDRWDHSRVVIKPACVALVLKAVGRHLNPTSIGPSSLTNLTYNQVHGEFDREALCATGMAAAGRLSYTNAWYPPLTGRQRTSPNTPTLVVVSVQQYADEVQTLRVNYPDVWAEVCALNMAAVQLPVNTAAQLPANTAAVHRGMCTPEIFHACAESMRRAFCGEQTPNDQNTRVDRPSEDWLPDDGAPEDVPNDQPPTCAGPVALLQPVEEP